MIESVGGALDLAPAAARSSVLAPDRELGLGLLFECLTQPAFPKEAFQRNSSRSALASLKDRKRSRRSVAARAFQAMVYGKHPFGRPRAGHGQDRREADAGGLRRLP